MIKLETCKNIIKQAKGVIKEFRHKNKLVDILKAMQKAENVNCSPKLPVKTRWVSMVTSSENTCFLYKSLENHFCSKNNLFLSLHFKA